MIEEKITFRSNWQVDLSFQKKKCNIVHPAKFDKKHNDISENLPTDLKTETHNHKKKACKLLKRLLIPKYSFWACQKYYLKVMLSKLNTIVLKIY